MWNPFVDKKYGGLNDLGFGACVIAGIASVFAMCWGVWYIWFQGPSCDYPNHWVYSGTSVVYVKAIPITVNDYTCVGP